MHIFWCKPGMFLLTGDDVQSMLSTVSKLAALPATACHGTLLHLYSLHVSSDAEEEGQGWHE